MSMLTITTNGLKIQFYCSHCCDDDDVDEFDDTEVMDFFRFEQHGAPRCEICDRKMVSDFLLLPPTNNPEINHI